ncbi:MAG: hypothetical protein COC09_08220 [Gammaproteobacteria bacterium]|nr:MAG: hypothetical protein COC09_08220 [Gammaproteobacteria bacterium]
MLYSGQNFTPKLLILVSISLCLCLLSPIASAKLYKWVDEQGNIHYSDNVPPKDINRKRELINDSGVRSVITGEAKTKEELLTERQHAALRKKEAENQRKVEDYQRNLVANYRDESDLIATRDRNIDSIQVSINFIEANLGSLRLDLESLIKEAAAFERSGKTTPKLLKTQIAETRSKIDEAEAFVKEKVDEQDDVRDKFNRDLELYRILTGTQRASATAR